MNILIIASGPSLSQHQLDVADRLKPVTIAINDNYLRAPWADVLYACDLQWWQWHENKEELKAFKGRKVTRNIEAAKKYNLEYIESSPQLGLSIDPKIIHEGMNSGYQAINLAYHMGGTRILLIGYDMQTTDNKAHWFGDHPNKVRSNYNSWLLPYISLADHAKKLNLEIINCTITTALTCFPRMDLKEALQ